MLSEGRFFPKAEFSEVSELWIQHTNPRHDNLTLKWRDVMWRDVKWHLFNFSKAEFVRIFTECSEVWIEHTTW